MTLREEWCRLLDDFRRIDDPTLSLKCSGWYDTFFMEPEKRSRLFCWLGLERGGEQKQPAKNQTGPWPSLPVHVHELSISVESESSELSRPLFRLLSERATKLIQITPHLEGVEQFFWPDDPDNFWCDYIQFTTRQSFKKKIFAADFYDHDYPTPDDCDLYLEWCISPLLAATEHAIDEILNNIGHPMDGGQPPVCLESDGTPTNQEATPSARPNSAHEDRDPLPMQRLRAAKNQIPFIRSIIAELSAKNGSLPLASEVVDVAKARKPARPQTYYDTLLLLKDEFPYQTNRGRPRKTG